jgi:carboxyl-terminal processing protease
LGDIGFAIDMIEQNYVEPVNRRELYKAAMTGIGNALDPFSSYIPAEQFGAFQMQLSQEFGGLGIVIEPPSESGRIKIVSTVYGSPAAIAGILPGDQIDTINGQSVMGQTVQSVSDKLRGKPGTSVELTVLRSSIAEPLAVRIERAIIETESVTGDRRKEDGRWDFLMQADPSIAYIRVEIFGEKTTAELEQALRSVRDKAKGLILDLRDNSGGLLPTATDLCDMFLDEGTIVSTVGRFGVVESIRKANLGVEIPVNIPMVVLINHDSASASEVTAGCLQDLHRATIIGERSFGKGSVQNVVQIEGGDAALRLTSAHYLPPSGRNIHRRKDAKDSDDWGVQPDEGFTVTLDEEQTRKVFERLRRRSNPTNESKAETDSSLSEDLQLSTAVKFLQQKI